MDNIKIGEYIRKLRTKKSLTQKEMGERLNVSFQAVSKWEKGETLPDVSTLLELCDVLGTTVDLLLNGGTIVCNKRSLITVSEIIEGFKAFGIVKKRLGDKSYFYLGMVEGINNKMNFDFEEALEKYPEVLYAEAIIQAIMFENKTVDMNDIKTNFNNKNMINEIEKIVAKTK